MSKHKHQAAFLRIVLNALFHMHFVLLLCVVLGHFTEEGSQMSSMLFQGMNYKGLKFTPKSQSRVKNVISPRL